MAITRRATLPARRKAREAAARTTATAKLGTGKRFAAVQKSVAASLKPSQIRPGQTREEAAAGIAARAGRKKWGKKRFQAMAIKGRR